MALDLTVLVQGATPSDQIGYHTAFEQMVDAGELSGYRAFPYRGATTPDEWSRLYGEVVDHMTRSGSNALLCQFFHGPHLLDPRPFLERVRRLSQQPVIATSCGDAYGPLLRPAPRLLRLASSVSDLTFASSMGRLAGQLASAGARRITLMPLGACDVRFGSAGSPPAERDRDFDVVFIGNRPGGRNLTRHLFWSGLRRAEAVRRLARRYGGSFGLFGHGWSGIRSWQGPIEFNDQVTTSQRGRVVFGGYPGSLCDYYTSDRPFIGALSGVPVVDHAVPLVDRLLAPEREWILTDGSTSVVTRIDALLEADASDRCAIGRSGAAAIRARHMTSHRARAMVRIMEDVRTAIASGREPARPRLDFFHDGVDPIAEAATALHAW